MKLCKCGAIVEKRCEKCYPSKHGRTTKERGYGHDHRRASEDYRREHPLCERCVMLGVLCSKSSESLHHIEKIADAPDKRMDPMNWLGLCDRHHEELEPDPALGREVKRWSLENYDAILSGERS